MTSAPPPEDDPTEPQTGGGTPPGEGATPPSPAGPPPGEPPSFQKPSFEQPPSGQTPPSYPPAPGPPPQFPPPPGSDPGGYGQPPSPYGGPAGYGYPAQPGGYPGSATGPGGLVLHPESGLYLPPGVELAGRGRRIGAYFLAIPLYIVTLGIGYVIWGLIAWSKGTSPALQVLGCKCWVPESQNRAGFWRMVLRDVVGSIATGILSIITLLISFILFLTSGKRQSLADLIGSTVVVHDPNKVIR